MEHGKNYDQKVREIEEYLDEVAVTIDSSVYEIHGQDIIENQIERVREILNKMLGSSKGCYDEGIILRASKILDELLNIYYRKKY